MAIFLPVAFMTGTIGKFFFQFGVTVGVAVFLSLICSLTLTPMLCAYFLNLRENHPKRPLPFGLPLAVLVGALVALAGAALRLAAWLWAPGLTPFAWPVLELADGAFGLLGLEGPWPLPEKAEGVSLLVLWLVETGAEFLAGALLTRY